MKDHRSPHRAVRALTCLGAGLFLLGLAQPSEGTEPARPNILVILADDMGWRDVSYHGSEIKTPHIDRIAAEGVELDRFYVQPTCSPTRSGLMTGKSPIRLGVIRPIAKIDETGLPMEETLLPEQLARLGYQSLMVGKWHLGHHTPDQFPQARGFEHFYGHVTGGIGYWDHNHGGGHDWQRNGETLREEGYATQLIANEAIRVLKGRDKSRPTFLYLAFNAPHLPNEALEEDLEKYSEIPEGKRRIHAAMVDRLDQEIGRVLGALEEEGMLENTIVFFSSDNGGITDDSSPDSFQSASNFLLRIFDRPIPFEGLEFLVANVKDGGSDNTPLPGGKGMVTEGGARVPAAIWWPGHLEGRTHEGFMTISDVLPTLLEAIGERDAIPDDLDGASQWSALRGEASTAIPDYVTHGLQGMAFYRAPWKLVLGDEPKLFQIYDDPTESKNLAQQEPERVSEMTRAADAWPRGKEPETSFFDIFLDPDRFGGPEDRMPWADAARENVSP